MKTAMTTYSKIYFGDQSIRLVF